jgi:hypothetical protein
MGGEKIKTYHRLWMAYRTLDTSMRNAEGRVPRDWLTKRLVANPDAAEFGHDVCSICMCALVDDVPETGMSEVRAILCEEASLSPGKRLHHQRSSRHATVPLSEASQFGISLTGVCLHLAHAAHVPAE